MHDEGDLRTMLAAPQGPEDRRGDGGVLLLQSGPAARSSGLGQSAHAPFAERGLGEADQAVDRPLPAAARRAAGARSDCLSPLVELVFLWGGRPRPRRASARLCW